MSNIAILEPVKTDKEQAEEYKQRIIEAYKPVIEVLNEASKNGFSIGVNCGPTPVGIQILNLQVSKVY